MKKDTEQLERHLKQYPTDAAGVISLLKARSYNYEYEFNLEQKKKREKMKKCQKKEDRCKNDSY